MISPATGVLICRYHMKQDSRQLPVLLDKYDLPTDTIVIWDPRRVRGIEVTASTKVQLTKQALESGLHNQAYERLCQKVQQAQQQAAIETFVTPDNPTFGSW